MDTSRNQNILPMRGTVERETLRKAREAQATRAVIAGIVEVGFNWQGDFVSQELPDPPEAA